MNAKEKFTQAKREFFGHLVQGRPAKDLVHVLIWPVPSQATEEPSGLPGGAQAPQVAPPPPKSEENTKESPDDTPRMVAKREVMAVMLDIRQVMVRLENSPEDEQAFQDGLGLFSRLETVLEKFSPQAPPGTTASGPVPAQ